MPAVLYLPMCSGPPTAKLSLPPASGMMPHGREHFYLALLDLINHFAGVRACTWPTKLYQLRCPLPCLTACTPAALNASLCDLCCQVHEYNALAVC